MSLTVPKPEVGSVIRYSYLRHDEHLRGRDEGTNDRPFAMIVALVQQGGGHDVLFVAVTHAQPVDPSMAVELSAPIKKRIGLDGDRSWVVLSECNIFG